jgi:uncharacterized protein (TIGR00369 family)
LRGDCCPVYVERKRPIGLDVGETYAMGGEMNESETGARTRTTRWEDPRTGARAARSMSGMEYLQAMERGDLPYPPILETLGLAVESVEEGRVVFSTVPAEFQYNPIGTVHGGVLATLADSAMGCAVHTTLPAGAGYTTLELKVNFLRPVTVESGPLRCEGTVIHAGSRVALAEARVIGPDGKLYAHATSTCMILRAESEARS